MKRKVPHIILRFSKHVPATAAHTPSENNIPTNSTKPDTAANDMARQSDAATRASKRNGGTAPLKSSSGRNKKSNNLESLAQVDKYQPPGSQSTKRKHADDLSVGGGKGDLPIPQKRARRSAAPEQHAGQASSQDEKGKKDEDKRVLRSQDSKLTEYAEWLEPEDKDAIDWGAPITLIDGNLPAITFNGDVISGGSANRTVGDVLHRPSENVGGANVTSPPHASETSVNSLTHPNHTTPVVAIDVSPRTKPIVTIDLEVEVRASKNRLPTRCTYDPLSADRYLKPHQGKVREEKRQRNLERERVVFQKAQYEKKLMNLKSEEWMKIFGLAGLVASGIDVDKKALEKRRAAMIKDLEGMLLRYNTCKEEERRRRVAKGGRASGSPVNSMDVETRKSSTEDYEVPLDDEDDEDEEGGETSAGNSGGPAGDEVDHQPNTVKKRRQKSKHSKPKKVSAVIPEPEPKPFTSFYKNPHDRKAAVSGWRRAGRNLSAFGQPLPEPESQEFKLPDEILNAAARHTRARRRVSR
ncbi:hypothetical protein L873DRAFT_1794892 [Choiromyces venosus 120613-1]|uniref:Something about silencing protein 4 domain-containing protein n=1 Tax=Choiromyces venosus 120613-1 TaxID=1336337 RepID=A0A3N4J2B4_9PEZI|nr:hypothetical protein L873DRAFT_1794892 [Choiromyces venosus 120613-1]